MSVSNSELNVLRVLWREGDMTASSLYKILEKEIGWNKNTTYTVVLNCIKKGWVQRIEPHYFCKTLVTERQIQSMEAKKTIELYFNGSRCEALSFLLESDLLTTEEKDEGILYLETLLNDVDNHSNKCERYV